MWAPMNYQHQIRPLPLSAPGIPQSEDRVILYGVPSCAPLVQHELLKAVREQMPSVYNHAAREIGLTVSGAQDLIERKVEIISAARAIRLARLIALERIPMPSSARRGITCLTRCAATSRVSQELRSALCP